MKAKAKRSLVIHYLELTEAEAKLLLGTIQNPTSDDEPDDVADFREDLFHALQEQLGKPKLI